MFFLWKADPAFAPCFSKPISRIRVLLIEKEEPAGGEENSSESLPMMVPSRREAHSSVFLHHLPAVDINQLPLGSLRAGTVTTCGRGEGRERSERRGQVERERERDILSGFYVDVPFDDNAQKYVAKASQTGN